MSPWVDPETGEASDGCPECENAELQVRMMEMELRRYRSKVTTLENAAERDTVAKRDGSLWNAVLAEWLRVFPDKKPSAKGIKSARATRYFQRLEAGAQPEDVFSAIRGAKEYPYVVYGKRTRTGSKSDEATDLQDICSVKNDAMFDWLRDAGRTAQGLDGSEAGA